MWRNSFVIFIKYICHGGFWLPLERVRNSKHFLFVIWTNLCMQKEFLCNRRAVFSLIDFFFFVSLSEVKRMRGILCSGFCESSSVFSSMTTTSDDAAALKFKSRCSCSAHHGPVASHPPQPLCYKLHVLCWFSVKQTRAEFWRWFWTTVKQVPVIYIHTT